MNTEHHLGYLFFNLHRSTPIIFSTGRRPAYGQPKGRRSIIMPWAIPPWLALVEFLGLTAKEYDKHDNDKATMSMMTTTTATATTAAPMTRMAATMATMTKVTWTAMGGGDEDCNNDDVDDNNDNNGTTTMQWRWRRRRWNDDNLMAMG